MKKLSPLLLIMVVAAFAFYAQKTLTVDKIVSTPSPTNNVLGTSKIPPDLVSLNGKMYKIYTTPFVSGEDITLIPNFTEKKRAEDIKNQNSCEYLINGGFYTEEARPVGYFKSESNPLKQEKDSALFDAFFTINELRTPRITRELPIDEIIYGVQVGPLLLENASYQKLSIKNDKEARRIVLAVNGENKVMFLSFVTQTSDFGGPPLSDLPYLLASWSKQVKIPLADAVNLDGGSASSFITPSISLTEISPIGSAFCVKVNL